MFELAVLGSPEGSSQGVFQHLVFFQLGIGLVWCVVSQVGMKQMGWSVDMVSGLMQLGGAAVMDCGLTTCWLAVSWLCGV